MKKKGRPVGENNRKERVIVRLNGVELALLDEISESTGLSRSEIMRESMRTYCLRKKFSR